MRSRQIGPYILNAEPSQKVTPQESLEGLLRVSLKSMMGHYRHALKHDPSVDQDTSFESYAQGVILLDEKDTSWARQLFQVTELGVFLIECDKIFSKFRDDPTTFGDIGRLTPVAGINERHRVVIAFGVLKKRKRRAR